MTNNSVGFFAWVKGLRGLSPEKYHIGRATNSMPDTKEHYNRVTVAQWPLDGREWAMTLNELALRYPAPNMPKDEKRFVLPKPDAGSKP